MHKHTTMIYALVAATALLLLPTPVRADTLPGYYCPGSTGALCEVPCTNYQDGPVTFGCFKIETNLVHVYTCGPQAGNTCHQFCSTCGVLYMYFDTIDCQTGGILGHLPVPNCNPTGIDWFANPPPMNSCNPNWPN